MAKWRAGRTAVLSQGVAGGAAQSPINKAKDINGNFEWETAEHYDRDTDGWIGQGTVGRKLDMAFTLNWVSEDPACAALYAAAWAGTPIALRLLDKPGGMGFEADFLLSGFPFGHALKEGQAVQVKCVLDLNLRNPTKI